MLRSALQTKLPEPTTEFRWKAWLAFQTALDRHLARLRRKSAVREMQPLR